MLNLAFSGNHRAAAAGHCFLVRGITSFDPILFPFTASTYFASCTTCHRDTTSPHSMQ
eukprot:m.703287 g.703287  ORF g.703287 m.703287 type:complete len:58 (+) comp22918_c0_seq32:234-407(+)